MCGYTITIGNDFSENEIYIPLLSDRKIRDRIEFSRTTKSRIKYTLWFAGWMFRSFHTIHLMSGR